jgi:peptidoglycan/xylan/chitin deacetylase (PgdA/CDA1 family)
MRTVLAVFVLLWFTGAPLFAGECPGNPDALGTSRTLAVSPTEYPRVGSMQYGQTLPLDDHEVVLTFDDGPLSPYTSRVLDILKAQCVQATFFIIGQMADSYPSLLRRIHD